MIENRPTWLKPSELRELGFSLVVYPNFVMLRSMLAARSALSELRELATAGKEPTILKDYEATRRTFSELVRESEWSAIENRFQ
jgi:2-methylisocitrate lyase-like PEP mutase family enzyme